MTPTELPGADRLYALLPAVHRMRDAQQGSPLRALLRVLDEQAGLIEADIAQLYDNAFIETCADWALPYIGDLIGYQPAAGARPLQGALGPRREIANSIALRRRKGTLALLELLAHDVAGWPARAVEYYKLLGWTQHLNFLHRRRARTANLRDGVALGRLGGAFEQIAHTVDVRRIGSQHQAGRFNIGTVGLFVYRLRSYSVTQTPAYLQEGKGGRRYAFSVLGNDTPLFVRPQAEASPEHIAREENLPLPIRRRALLDGAAGSRVASGLFYGPGLSLSISAVDWPKKDAPQPIPRERVLVADLSDWQHYRAPRGYVAVDPVLGRIAFPDSAAQAKGVRVSYQYGFSADMGGGEYPRALAQPVGCALYRVGRKETLQTINAALALWQDEKTRRRQLDPPTPLAAVIELADSDVYTEALGVVLDAGESLQIRAAKLARPVLRLLDQVTDLDDAFSVKGQRASRLLLDGLLVTGRGLRVIGPEQEQGTSGADGDLCDLRIRHCTLVPGWGVGCDCDPDKPNEPSIELVNSTARLCIEHSIVGSIFVTADEVTRDPVLIDISDSIVDATSDARMAIASGAGEGQLAFASLRLLRCTVIGQVLTHAMRLAENSILSGATRVARRQLGCLRFCYVAPGSRTPRRFQCQPDLAERALEAAGAARAADLEAERLRVQPRFTSLRYTHAGYCQLHSACAGEIAAGAGDESEMGAFHDLYQPQRGAGLRTRLAEYTPAAMEAGIIYAT